MSPQPQPVISPSLGRLRQLDSVGRSPGGHGGGELRRGGGCGYLELGGVVVWDAVSVQAAAAAPHGVRAA